MRSREPLLRFAPEDRLLKPGLGWLDPTPRNLIFRWPFSRQQPILPPLPLLLPLPLRLPPPLPLPLPLPLPPRFLLHCFCTYYCRYTCTFSTKVFSLSSSHSTSFAVVFSSPSSCQQSSLIPDRLSLLSLRPLQQSFYRPLLGLPQPPQLRRQHQLVRVNSSLGQQRRVDAARRFAQEEEEAQPQHQNAFPTAHGPPFWRFCTASLFLVRLLISTYSYF